MSVARTRSEHRKGVLLMIAASTCWSLSGILVRNVSLDDSWAVMFWRSVFTALTMAMVLVIRHRSQAIASVVRTGRAGVLSGIFLAAMIVFFMLAIQMTTIANIQAIAALAPFIAALLAWIALGERLAGRTVVAMAFALIGMILMFADSLGGGRMTGNLLALAVPVVYALNVTLLRKMGKSVDMLPSILLGSVFSLVVAAPFVTTWSIGIRDLSLMAFMGSMQLAMGCVLFTWAARYLSAAEITLIGLLESLLAPTWVWIGVGETPSNAALIGGLIVLASLVLNELWGHVGRASRRQAVESA